MPVTTVNINIELCRSGAVVPTYAHGPDEDAGYDLIACIEEPILLLPHMPCAIPTGLKMQIPPGFEGQVRSRSGLALKHGVLVANAPGTVDPGYRGEVCVILILAAIKSHSIHPYFTFEQCDQPYPAISRRNKEIIDENRGEINGYIIKPGDRIAQMVIAPYATAEFTVEGINETDRGAGGFGSTGR